jgi:hypothetical protein
MSNYYELIPNHVPEEIAIILDEAYHKKLSVNIESMGMGIISDEGEFISPPKAHTYNGFILQFTETGFVLLSICYDKTSKQAYHAKQSVEWQEVMKVVAPTRYPAEWDSAINKYLGTMASIYKIENGINDEDDAARDVDIVKMFAYVKEKSEVPTDISDIKVSVSPNTFKKIKEAVREPIKNPVKKAKEE